MCLILINFFDIGKFLIGICHHDTMTEHFKNHYINPRTGWHNWLTKVKGLLGSVVSIIVKALDW